MLSKHYNYHFARLCETLDNRLLTALTESAGATSSNALCIIINNINNNNNNNINKINNISNNNNNNNNINNNSNNDNDNNNNKRIDIK